MAAHRRAVKALFEATSLGSPENAVGFVLWRVVHRYQRELERALSPLGLTHLQFQTLALCAWMTKSGEAVTQSKLAQAGDIQPMQVSYMLRALEEKGFVERAVNEADIRAKVVQPTAAGLKALRQAFPVAMAVQRQLFGVEGLPGGSLHAALLEVLQSSSR